jgi:maleylacetate reductase
MGTEALIYAPTALRAIGMREDDLEDAIGLVPQTVPADNPRPVKEDDVRRLLEAAFAGRAPEPMIEEAR